MDSKVLGEKLRLEICINTADYPNERIIRSILSQLRKKGVLFIPSEKGKGIYIRIDYANQNEIESYAKAQARHFKTQYFNTMLPMKQYVEDLKLLRMLGRLEGILDEEKLLHHKIASVCTRSTLIREKPEYDHQVFM